MNYGNIKCPDIANGLGCRVSLFVSGCEFYCPQCFNQQIWDFNAGKKYTEKTQKKIIELLKPSYIQGLSILGGEPLHHKNIKTIDKLINEVKFKYPNKDIWLYTGFTWEQIMHNINKNDTYGKKLKNIISNINILVDGLFEINKKDISLNFRGSSNQRLIITKKSNENNITLLNL